MRRFLRIVSLLWTVGCFLSFELTYVQTGAQTSFAMTVCLFSLIGTWGLWSVTGTRRPATTHGSASWADKRSLKGLLQKRGVAPKPGALVLGLRDRSHAIVLPPELARLHTLVVGGSGSGKTWGFFLPNAAEAQGSFVATDPKGELWHHTSGCHRRAWRFAPHYFPRGGSSGLLLPAIGRCVQRIRRQLPCAGPRWPAEIPPAPCNLPSPGQA